MPRYLLRGYLAAVLAASPLPHYTRSAPIIGLAVLAVVVIVVAVASRRSRRR
jgi:general stress protein CsbA